MNRLGWVIASLLACGAAQAGEEAMSSSGEVGDAEGLCTSKAADPGVYFRVPCIDDAYEAYQRLMAKSPVRLGLGAYHWFNVQRRTGETTYGYPGAEGTYFYYANLDIDNSVFKDQPVKFGIHTQARYRDQSLFRTYFANRTWLYEAYGWVDTPVGTVKAGKVRNRIGFDWDNSFWGNVPYFDGYKLDPDYGVSLEKTWQLSDKLSLESYQQFYFAEDNVNGSIAGGDAESAPGYDEDRTWVVRFAPRWKFNDHMSLGGGISGFHQHINNDRAIPLPNGTFLRHGETVKGYALDLDFKLGNLDVYAEYLQSFGIRNPVQFSSAGPSDESSLPLFGASYQWGPTRLRATYSRGEYQNPGGHQNLYVFGTDIELTKYLTLIGEYVNWTVRVDGTRTAKYEDAFELVLNWHL